MPNGIALKSDVGAEFLPGPNPPSDLLFTTETSFHLSSNSFLEPDFVFYPKAEGLVG